MLWGETLAAERRRDELHRAALFNLGPADGISRILSSANEAFVIPVAVE